NATQIDAQIRENGPRQPIHRGRRYGLDSGTGMGIRGGEQELEHGAGALCPRGLMVRASGKSLIAKGVPNAPALHSQPSFEQVGVGNGTLPFALADIQPDAWTGLEVGSHLVKQGENGPVIPPHRGRKYSESAEDVRKFEPEIERGQRAERGAAEAGIRGPKFDSVAGGDEGKQLLNQKAAVFFRLAAAELPVSGRSVFGQTAVPCIGDAN